MPEIEIGKKQDIQIDIGGMDDVNVVVHPPKPKDIIIESEDKETILTSHPKVLITVEPWQERSTSEQAFDMASEAIKTANYAFDIAKRNALDIYTMDEYLALRNAGKLEHKMYCIYTNGILTRIYIYRTLIAKRAKEGQIATGSTFPIIFPIIFA